MARIPPGWNPWPIVCYFCGDKLPEGAGPMRRGIHPRKPRKLGRVWLVDHPGCPGLIPDTDEGWVYACTGVGPGAEFIKVGCTSRTPSDRMNDLFPGYFRRVRLSQITLWGAYSPQRYKDERRLCKALADYRAPPDLGLGIEVFSAPLPLVLRQMEEIVSGMIELFAWGTENFATGESYIFGYPVKKFQQGRSCNPS